PTEAEKTSLEQAIELYQSKAAPEDTNVLEAHLRAWPQSPYALALLTGIGVQKYHSGFFTEAIDKWSEVWRRRDEAGPTVARSSVDRAIGELIRMRARVGHVDEL